MAEPANTPVPASTPRATSPAHGASAHQPHANHSQPLSPTQLPAVNLSHFHLRNTPRHRVLLLGGPSFHDEALVAAFKEQYDVVQPPAEERQRPEFLQALKEGRWGGFEAIVKPAWGVGGEMGNWDEELIASLPGHVKVFAGAGAGFDAVDVRALGERGIIYCNAGLAAASAVADFAVAMIISTFRHLPWCTAAAHAPASFQACHRDAVPVSRNLRGKKLGIIGFGNIGQEIAQRCFHGFGMRIAYFDIEDKPASAARGVEAERSDTLQGLLGACDVVVLCVPGGPRVINETTTQWFQPGSRFVNVARGSLVDENAVVAALESGRLSAVALDVFETEPDVHPGLKRFATEEGGWRAMLSCHNAGGTVETHQGFEKLCLENVDGVLQGKGAVTPVNMQYLK